MHSKHSKKVRLLAIIFAVVIALSVLAPVLSTLSYAAQAGEATEEEQNKIDALGQKFQALQAQQEKIKQQLNVTTSEKQKQVAINQQIGAQISNTQQQIDILTERITLLQENIDEKERQKEEKQKEYEATYEMFKVRLAALVKAPPTSTLGMVLGADSYSQVVDRAEIMSRVAAYDRNLMDTLEKEKQELDAIQKQIEADMASVEDDKTQMDQKRQELSAQQAQTQKQIQDISALEEQFRQDEAKMKAQMAQVQAEMQKIYQEIAARSTMSQYVGGEMQFPVPGLNQITSNFGWRFNNADNHTGVDFAGPNAYGHAVLAANDGVVAKVVTADTPGYGYGKYVIIDHGGGITTLYAHNSAVLVSEGQAVQRGDTIAQVGSTGWATGPHCHFEVRINGSPVNPLPYVMNKNG